MNNHDQTYEQLEQEIEDLRARLADAEAALDAIRSGEVDALLVHAGDEEQVFLLQGAERPYRMMVETMNEGAATLLEDGCILYANPRLAALLDEPAESLIGASIYDYVAAGDIENLQSAVELGLRQPGKTEIKMRRRDHSSMPVLISFNPTETEGHLAICAVMTDLTEHIYANQLRQSNQELQDFAFVASHDLQEPLRKIIGFSDMIGAPSALDDAEKDYLRRMQEAARRMQKMIDDLLDLSRVSARTRAFSQVDLNQVLKTVVDDLDPRLGLASGSITLHSLPVIEADAAQMQRLFQNLVINAIKFHRKDAPPLVEVGYREYSPVHAEVYVKDNGIGFDMKLLDEVFLPFRRLHSRTEYEGTGIGLAICRRIAERHGGWITAKSVPGEGSTFLVILPIKQKQE